MLLALLISTALAQAKPPKPPEPELLLAVTLPEVKDDEGRPELRILFRKAAGKWEVIGGNEHGAAAPARARWKPCGGKVEVETRAAPDMDEGYVGWAVGVQQLAKKSATLPSGEAVLVSGGACDDPEGWKRIAAKTVPIESVAKAFASESAKLAANLELPAPKASPKSLRVTAAYESSDGRRLVAVELRDPPGAEADDDPAWVLAAPIWISVAGDGTATAVEVGGKMLRLADFDGDGKSDLLLHFTIDGTDGYLLHTGGFAERTVWQYRY